MSKDVTKYCGLPREAFTKDEAVGDKTVHRPMIVRDSEAIRDHFLAIADELDEDTKLLRREKMSVYGLSFCKNGWDSIFENIRRKYDSVHEVLFRHICLLREAPSDKQLAYLYDALLDLKNYSCMALWFLIAIYGNRLQKIKGELEERRQV